MTPKRTEAPLPAPGRRWFLNVLALYGIRLRHRWLQELLAVVGIAAGVALLFASQVASTSLSGPVQDLNRGLVGNSQLQLVGRGADGFPESVADRVRKLPGVKIAAPVLQVQANVVGPRGSRPITLFGADPRTVELRGDHLQGFTAEEASEGEAIGLPEPIAATTGVRFGDNARLQIAGRNRSVPVAVVGKADVGDLVGTAIALSPLAYLQKLAQLDGRISRVLVQTEPGRLDAVREQLTRLAGSTLDVRPADFESQLFDVAAAPTSQATTISSVVSALVGFLFAFCAMLVTVASRRALAIDLRLDGYRPGQIIRILLLDALVLAAIAIVVGLAFGDFLSRRGYGSDVSFLGGAFPLGDVRVVTWSAVAIAAGGGLLAAVLGVLAPQYRIVFGPPTRSVGDAGRGAAVLPRWLLPMLGGLSLAAAIAITVAVPSAAIVGLLALVLSLVLLLPTVLSAVVGLLAALSRRRKHAIVAIELALPQLRARAWRARSLAIAMTGAIAVFGAVALQGARANLQAGLDGVSSELNGVADVWVSPYGTGGLLATAPFSPALTEKLRGVAGVRAIDEYRGSFLDVAGRRAWVVAPPTSEGPAVPASQILEGRDLTKASTADGDRWAAVSRGLADRLGLRVGDRFTLPAPEPIALRVAAITTNLGWSGGSIVLQPDDYVRAWRGDAISADHVQLDAGVSPEIGRRRIERALGPKSALLVETGAERSARQQDSARNGLSRLSQIATLTLVAAVLAMASAMAALLWQRRPMVARQKLDGHSTGVMWRTLAVESGALFVTGCLAGAVFALLGQVLFSRGLATISGFPVVATVRGGIAAASFAMVTAVALIVVLIPGFLVARTQASLRTGD